MSFELILDYEEFRVYYDCTRSEYVYIDRETFDTIPLQKIASLEYDINNQPLFLDTMFDNFCCGEQVLDDKIVFHWFDLL